MDLIKKAIIDFTKAFRYFKGSKFWIQLLLSGLIALTIGFCFFFAAYKTGAWMADFLSDLYPFEFGKNAAFTFFHLIPLTYILAVMIMKYFIYIAVSPFMLNLSRRIEQDHTGSMEDFSKGKWNLFSRTILITVRSIYKEILWTILFSLVGILVPVAGIAGLVITQAYYIGYAHLDYTLSRKIEYPKVKTWIKNNRGLALGNGAIYFTLLLTPVLGLFIAPAVATAAGTLSVTDVIKKKE